MLPEEIHRQFTICLLKKDLDALVNLYHQDAVFINEAGEEVRGRESIKAELKQFVPIAETMQPTKRSIFTSKDTSFVNLGWKATIDGENHNFNALEVLKQNEDGQWQYLIDNPFGH